LSRLERRHRKATDPRLRAALELDVRKAKKKLSKAMSTLARFDAKREKADNEIVGGPVGLRSSGVGIVRVGSGPRAVGDSTAVNRKHSFRRR
jgi:hypothetical protein